LRGNACFQVLDAGANGRLQGPDVAVPGQEIEAARGVATPKSFSADEQKYRKYSKKSIVASRALAKGTIIDLNDLVFMRAPELGLPPDRSDALIGRATSRDVAAYELISEQDVT